nr:M protein [Betaricinrhavirus chimay]
MAVSKPVGVEDTTPFRFCIKGSIEVSGPCTDSLIPLMALQVMSLYREAPLTVLGKAYLTRAIRDEMAMRKQVLQSQVSEYVEDPIGFGGRGGGVLKTKWLFTLNKKGLVGERALQRTEQSPVLPLNDVFYPRMDSELRDLRMEISSVLSYQTVEPSDFLASQHAGYYFIDRPSQAFLANFDEMYEAILNREAKTPSPHIPPLEPPAKKGIKNSIGAFFRRSSSPRESSSSSQLAITAPVGSPGESRTSHSEI